MPRKSRWARLPFALRMSIGGAVALSVVAAGVAGVATMFTEKPRTVQSIARERAPAPTVDAAPVDTSPAEALPPREQPTADSGLGALADPTSETSPAGVGAATSETSPPGAGRATSQASLAGQLGATSQTSPAGQVGATSRTSPVATSPTSPAATSPTSPAAQGGTPDKILAGDPVDRILTGPQGGPAPDAPNRTVVRQPRPRPQVKLHVSPGPVTVVTASDARAEPAAPAVIRRTITETKPIAFTTRRVQDWSLAPGARQIQTPGVLGERTLRFRITLSGGTETARRLLDATVTKEPQEQVIAFRPGRGAEPAPDWNSDDDQDPDFEEPQDCWWADEPGDGEPWDEGFGVHPRGFCG